MKNIVFAIFLIIFMSYFNEYFANDQLLTTDKLSKSISEEEFAKEHVAKLCGPLNNQGGGLICGDRTNPARG